MAKISTRKLTLSELRFHFNRKNNNIEIKRFWVRQTSLEKHWKGEFHVFVKEQKLLNHKLANERAFYYQFDFSTFLSPAFSRCAFAKLKIFRSAERLLIWTPSLKGTCKIKQCKKCRRKWTMYCVKSVQDCAFVLLINPNGIHTKI